MQSCQPTEEDLQFEPNYTITGEWDLRDKEFNERVFAIYATGVDWPTAVAHAIQETNENAEAQLADEHAEADEDY